MSAGAGYVSTADTLDVEVGLACYLPASGPNAGVPTQIRYREVYNVDGTFNYVEYTDLSGTVLALNPAEISSIVPGRCGSRSRSATIKIAGPTAPAGTGPDGTTFDVGTWLAQPAIQALVGGVAVLTGWEVVATSSSNPATNTSANRIEVIEQSNGNGTGAARALSLNESVSANDEDGIDSPVFTAFGTARATIQISYRRAGA